MAIELSEKQITDGWQIVKFGEIAKNISKRVEPAETDLEVYVGLEHLDPQSLRITRRGVPDDVIGQKLRVRPGQIIFGKRRAYQKKVAVADFDGICSAHAMVLEEVVGKIIHGLLPFFMQSDMFMDRAVAISEGSLSPTIKWKTLETQEFPLPPIERQKEILEVLEKATTCNQLYNDSLDMCQFNQNNYLTSWLTEKFPKEKWVRLDSALQRSPEYGAAETAIEYTDETFRYIRVTDINNRGELIESARMGAPKAGNEKYLLFKDDFLIARSGNTVGKTFLYKESVAPSAIFAGYLIRLKFDSNHIIPEFFKFYCRTPIFWRWLEATARGGAQPNINAQQISKMKIPIPTVVEQEKALEVLRGFEQLSLKISGQYKKSYQLNQLYFANAFNGGVQ